MYLPYKEHRRDSILNKIYTTSIMTIVSSFDIVKAEEKADLRVQGKEGTQMNTMMILSHLKYERLEKALDIRQGLVCAYTILRERNHVFRDNNPRL